MSLTMPARPLRLTLRADDHLPADISWRIDDGYVRANTWNEEGESITLGIWGPGELITPTGCGVTPYELISLTRVVVVECRTERRRGSGFPARPDHPDRPSAADPPDQAGRCPPVAPAPLDRCALRPDLQQRHHPLSGGHEPDPSPPGRHRRHDQGHRHQVPHPLPQQGSGGQAQRERSAAPPRRLPQHRSRMPRSASRVFPALSENSPP